MRPPETRYARSADGVHVAYQVFGAGDVDVVFIPGFVSHLELTWQMPGLARFMERLAAFSRVITFDKPGTGLSDPVPVAELPTLEQRMDDLRAVMDAAASERAVVVGVSEGGPMAMLFAATHPDRVTALVLIATTARFRRAEDAPWGWSDRVVETMLRETEARWGTGTAIAIVAPTAVADPLFDAGRFERSAASPGAAAAIIRMSADTDARAVLPSISVRTLVVHRVDDRIVPVEAGRDLAARIPGARLVELPGEDHAFFSDPDPVVDQVEEFVTGTSVHDDPDRVLATMLFTDIVGSTRTAAELGDRRWRELLDAHDAVVSRQLDRFRGRPVKQTGDGHLAAFDGPARAIRCGLAIRDGVRPLGLNVRVGIHTGEVELRGEDLTGISVVTAARVMSHAGDDQVWVSQTVRDLVAGSGLRFEDRGEHELKGVPGTWRLWQVVAN
jgi:pimeloyl-ACP methyl ester carboxylesterase